MSLPTPDAGLHATLRRQLRRLQLSEEHPPDSVETWRSFLARINQAYANHREDQYLVERSLEVVSGEMQELHAELQRNAESRVAAERDRLQAIISGFSDAFASMDTDGVMLTLNPTARAMLGEDAVGENLSDRLAFGDTVSAEFGSIDEVRERLRAGDTIRDEGATIQTADGTRAPVSVLLFPITQGGAVTSYGITMRDIGDRILAERTLRRLARAVDASADAIYTTDPDGTIEYVNTAFTAITGFTADEAVGRNARLMQSGRTPAAHYREMWAALAAGHVWNGRLLNRRPLPEPVDGRDHEYYWVQSAITPYFDAAGTLLGYVSVQRDVSEHVAVERRQSVEAFAARLRAEVGSRLQSDASLIERLHQVTALLADSFGAEAGEPVAAVLRLYGRANLAAADIANEHPMPFGWQSQVPWPRKGDPNARFVVVADDAARRTMDGSALALIPVSHAHEIIGCVVLASTTTLPIPKAVQESCQLIGEMIGLSVADYGAWQAAEDARRAALEAAQAKSKFLANMSHEIRTPMNGVLGMLDMLRHTELTDRQLDYLSIAHTSAESLLTVINDILDFSKIEAGRVHLEQIPFDVRAATEDVATLFSATAAQKDIEVACSVPRNFPTGVRGDPTRLRQILSNVIGNAVKFTQKGEVVVRVSVPDDPDLEPAPDEIALRFEVADTGIGMSEASVARLFVPFSQADASMTRRFGGTGLGLAIARQLIELMGSKIHVDSEEGVGTTFWFDLVFPRQPDAEDPLLQVESLAGSRVLVVDDNETNRTILAHYLRDWNLDLDTACDGAEALARVRDAAEQGRPYRIAMLDMQMPGLDGATLARHIKQDPLTDATRLVLVSSTGVSEELLHDSGFDYSMTKPVRQSVVHDILLEMIGPRMIPRARTPYEPVLADGGRVLLAEDNAVNQRVAVGMLEMMGLDVSIAADGARALEMLQSESFDLVLMDCQMPVMDGYEATRRLRMLPGTARLLPVVAMTANAMKGDREECIAAGMDDYVAKPFTLQQLSGVLVRWLGRDRATVLGSGAGEAEASLPRPAPAFDMEALVTLEEVMGDAFSDLVSVFRQEGRELLDRMRMAVVTGDPEDMRLAAHSLKSTSEVFGACGLSTIAAELEAGAHSAPSVDAVVRTAEEEFERVSVELERLLAGAPAS
jgi:PAS domain S-box-containing protein